MSRKNDADGYWEPYNARATILRNWFMAYGIGSLAAILTSDNLRHQVVASAEFRPIVGFFLIGVAIQIILSLIYKHVMSYLYITTEPNERFVNFTHKIWPDLTADLVTLICFGYATCLVVGVLTGTK